MLITKTKKALCLSISLMALSSASASDCPNLAKALVLMAPLITSASECAPDPIREQIFVTTADGMRSNLVERAARTDYQSLRHHFISKLMDDEQPWHEGTPACCLAVKRCLAERADMKWHNNCTLGDDWPIWMAAIGGIPVTGCTATACSYGCPVTAAGILCCGLGIPCALKIFEQRQAKPENLRSTLDWLGSSCTWQERVATHAPRPMTMHID